MAVTTMISNKFKYEKGIGNIDFSNDVFKAVLMADGFTYNRDTHGQLTNVSASIISATGGYAEATLTTDTAWNQDDVNDVGAIDWENVTWTADGDDFDDFSAVIIYDDTHADDVIVGCIDLGQTISLLDGNSFQLQNIGFESGEEEVV